MKNLVKEADELLKNNPDMCYYRWYGLIYRHTDEFSRLDKAFLFCAYTYEGVPQYIRTVGFPDKVVDGPDEGEERVVFTSEVVYRIKYPEDRKGRICSEDKLRPGDHWEIAGIYKNLEYGKEPEHLDKSRKQDRLMMNMLQDIDKAEETDRLEVPEIYLCTNNAQDIYLRNNEDAIKYLSGFTGYDSKRPPEANLKKLFSEIAVPAGKNANGSQRYGLPFRYVYGRGVKALSTELNGQWYKCPLSECRFDDGFVEVSI